MSDLITTWLTSGDLTGFLIAIFTSEIGSMAYLFFLMIGTIPVYNRYGAIPTSIVWVLFWSTLNIVIPPQALNLAVGMLGISLGIMVYLLYQQTRRVY